MKSPCEGGIQPLGFISQLVKATGKRPLGRPRRRWEGNIRMYLEEIGINAGNLVDLSQDRDF